MTKLSIVQFHRFMRGAFGESIRWAYRTHQIFCEADLQSFAWDKIRRFLTKNEEAPGKFRVLNKPFLRDCKTYPDLVVFRRKTPWVVIELKESRRMTERRAATEREKLLSAKNILTPKRGYLVYVARYGAKRALHGAKGKGAHYFFEVPIVLSLEMDKAELKQWRVEFRRWSKYVRNPETHA
jgi:hypothetical protein